MSSGLSTIPGVVLAYRIMLGGLGALVLLLTGCTGSGSAARARMLAPVSLPPPLAVAEPTPLPAPTTRETSPLAPPASVASLSPAPTNLVSLVSPHPALTPYLRTGQRWPVAWSNVWVPLETWARMNGLGQPTALGAGTEPTFAIGSADGMIRLKIGSQTAHAGGHDSVLGFAPRLVGGIAYLHSLDLQKTLQPLVSGGWEIPAPTNRVIVIDPGHGGRDSGTLNGFGTENEKYFTLDWARRLEPLLAAAGWKVILTRTNDMDVPLADRVQIADVARADLFLSLHFNAGGANAAMNGLETFCLTPTGLPSSLRRDFEDDPREILPNNTHDQGNFLLASRLHRALLKISGATDRGVRRARFMTVLRLQNRPAVLIEGGYLSNPQEARRIATTSYRQLLAEAVAQVLNAPEPSATAETTSVAPVVRTPPVRATVTAAANTATNAAPATALAKPGASSTSAAANP